MSNPLVRSKLKFYSEEVPEDVPYEDASQAQQWRELCDADLSGPMARSESSNGATSRDYYVYEPALTICENTYLPVMVTRWIMRSGQLWAKVHRLRPDREKNGYYVEGLECTAVPFDAFVESFPSFDLRHMTDYNLPSPSNILG